MKKLAIFIILLFAVPYGLRAQTGQFKAVATSATTFTWYFIPSQDFVSSGNLTFDVTMEIDNSAGCGNGLATAPVLAVSNITYANAASRSPALGTATSGGTKTAAGVTPAFWNQRYIFAAVSTTGTPFTGGQMYPLASFTLPAGVPSVNCIKILDWNNDRIGNGVSTGAVNGDTHISINGLPNALVDNNAALFVRATTSNGYVIGDISNSGATNATSYMPLGWDEKPVANPVTQTLSSQPTVDQIITLDGNSGNPPAQNGSDFEDGALGGSTLTSSVVITQLPTNGELYYNGGLVSVNQVIPNFNASLITVKLTGSGYTSTTFRYTFVDSKGFQGDAVAYTLNWGSALPVTLVSFTVRNEGQTAQLNWATTAETNSEKFDIQRSANAKEWKTIGTRAAAGESKVTVSYNFTDLSPVNGTNYYRLKMSDRDATFAFSSIKSAEFAGVGVKLYPNPVTSTLFLKDINATDVKELSIINASGIAVYNAKAVSTAGINVANFSNGIYVVKVVKTDGTVSNHKVVIAK